MNNILITGASGLVGSALVKHFKAKRINNILIPTHNELDLRDYKQVQNFFKLHTIEYVIHCAAVLDGINVNANTKYEKLLYNSIINQNIIEIFRQYCDKNSSAKKLLFIGSMCAYPDNIKNKITENTLLTGKLEQENEGYALSKIYGIKLCQYLNNLEKYKGKFISCMPANVYGINNSYNSKSHLIPAIIKKIYRAKMNGEKSIYAFGNGKQIRSFIFTDDLAAAIELILKKYSDSELINIGSGIEVSINDIIQKISHFMQYNVDIIYSGNKYIGSKYRVEDPTKIFQLGWKPTIDIDTGLNIVINDFYKKEIQK